MVGNKDKKEMVKIMAIIEHIEKLIEFLEKQVVELKIQIDNIEMRIIEKQPLTINEALKAMEGIIKNEGSSNS